MRAIFCALSMMLGTLVIAQGQTPVFTNRTPDAAKITPTPTPGAQQSGSGAATLEADPALYPPGTGSKGVAEFQPDQAYFVCLRNVTRVLVSDARGRTDDLFNERSVPKVRSATYEFVDSDAVYIIVPVKETYSIVFETNEPVMFLEILKGRRHTSPDEAIRYRDLVLDGKRAKFELTPNEIRPLRLDGSRSGLFDSVIEPTVSLHGAAAHDTTPPEVTVQIVERTGKFVVVTISAKDAESGVKSVRYSLDSYREKSGGYYTFLYQGPLKIDVTQSAFLWALADDYAANGATLMYDLRK